MFLTKQYVALKWPLRKKKSFFFQCAQMELGKIGDRCQQYETRAPDAQRGSFGYKWQFTQNALKKGSGPRTPLKQNVAFCTGSPSHHCGIRIVKGDSLDHISMGLTNSRPTGLGSAVYRCERFWEFIKMFLVSQFAYFRIISLLY